MNEMPPEKNDRNDRDFFRVFQMACALSIGSMAGFLCSLKQVHPSIRLELGVGTALVFLGASIFSWFLCGMLAKAGKTAPNHGQSTGATRGKTFVRWLVFFLIVCGLGTVGAFVYALKDVSSQSRRDVVEGTVIACLVLAAGGWLIRKAVCFFEEHSEAELEDLRDQEKDDAR